MNVYAGIDICTDVCDVINWCGRWADVDKGSNPPTNSSIICAEIVFKVQSMEIG